MSYDNSELSKREEAEIKQIEAETRHKAREEKNLKNESLLMNIGFTFRWIIIWLTVGGFIRFDLLEGVIKWING